MSRHGHAAKRGTAVKRTTTILMLSVMILAAHAQSIAKPTAEITQFQMQAISLRDVTFRFELTVSNPYPLGLSFSGMTLDFSVEGSKVFSAANQGGFSVPARGKKSSAFNVTLTYADIYRLVQNYSTKEWLNTVINGTLSIPLPRIPGLPSTVSFAYKLEKKIPAIKPTVAITGFSVTPPSASEVAAALVKAGRKADPEKARGAIADILAGKKPAASVMDPADLDLPLKISFTIQIKNNARGPLTFSTLGYELFINNESLVVGNSSSIRQDGQQVLITVANTFSTRRLTSGVKALFTDGKGSFRVKGSATMKLPDEVRKEPISLGFDEGGTFSIK
jgi:LEA14-like dessication related protein